MDYHQKNDYSSMFIIDFFIQMYGELYSHNRRFFQQEGPNSRSETLKQYLIRTSRMFYEFGVLTLLRTRIAAISLYEYAQRLMEKFGLKEKNPLADSQRMASYVQECLQYRLFLLQIMIAENGSIQAAHDSQNNQEPLSFYRAFENITRAYIREGHPTLAHLTFLAHLQEKMRAEGCDICVATDIDPNLLQRVLSIRLETLNRFLTQFSEILQKNSIFYPNPIDKFAYICYLLSAGSDDLFQIRLSTGSFQTDLQDYILNQTEHGLITRFDGDSFKGLSRSLWFAFCDLDEKKMHFNNNKQQGKQQGLVYIEDYLYARNHSKTPLLLSHGFGRHPTTTSRLNSPREVSR